jgi:hypothetical protein
MAKKARKKSKAKSKKKSKVKKKTRRATKGFKAKVSGAYRTVVDTFKGTDRLRNKLEKPGTSESE